MAINLNFARKEGRLTAPINGAFWDLPSPSSITYFWNFGSTLGICLVIQILTGLFLRFHYASTAEERFASVVIIIREVWAGWVVRFIHINGASMFFVFAYLHLFRGLYYFRSVHSKVWASGVTILILLMAISFLGYVLPWGQMSYWAVAVITNLFSVVPIIGEQLVFWIWGGFSVGAPTLTRFYSFHFILPFILAALVLIHLILLHERGSRNRIGLPRDLDKIPFHPYFTVKDLLYVIVVLSLFLMVSFYYPYILGDSVNNVPANPIQTPVHIQPEWYFLPSYAILRSLPSKTAGVIALFLSVSIFYILPFYKLNFSVPFKFYRVLIFWTTVATFFFLMKMGSLPAEEPYVLASKIASILYFRLILTINVWDCKLN